MTTIRFEDAREWAINRAADWALDEFGRDRLTIGDIRPAWPLRVEAFNRLMPVATSVAGIRSDFGGGGLKQRAEDLGVDRAARLLSLRTLPVGGPGPHVRNGPPVAFLTECATPTGVESMRAVASVMPPGSFRSIAVDARTARLWKRRGIEPSRALLRWREELSAVRQARAALKGLWAELAASPREFRIAGTDVTRRAVAALAPPATNSLPWLAAEQRAIGEVLDMIRPNHRVMASDQHRWGRLTIDAASARGVLPGQHVGAHPAGVTVLSTDA